MEVDLGSLFRHWKGGAMYAGFTASTGRLYGSHAISEWTFYEVVNGERHAGRRSVF